MIMKEDQVYPLKKVSDLIEILKKFDPETNIVGGEIQKESLRLDELFAVKSKSDQGEDVLVMCVPEKGFKARMVADEIDKKKAN